MYMWPRLTDEFINKLQTFFLRFGVTDKTSARFGVTDKHLSRQDHHAIKHGKCRRRAQLILSTLYLSGLTPLHAARAAAIAAKQNFTDIDIIRFLTNVECLEGLFDTWGTFGHGFIQNLELGGPTPIGARAAALTEATRPFLQEIALNEQVASLARTADTMPWACHNYPHALYRHHMKTFSARLLGACPR